MTGNGTVCMQSKKSKNEGKFRASSSLLGNQQSKFKNDSYVNFLAIIVAEWPELCWHLFWWQQTRHFLIKCSSYVPGSAALFFGLKKRPFFLMATTRASLRASCVTSLEKIPDNLNFNNSKKNEKRLIFATKANDFLKASTSLFMLKRLGLASLAVSRNFKSHTSKPESAFMKGTVNVACHCLPSQWY